MTMKIKTKSDDLEKCAKKLQGKWRKIAVIIILGACALFALAIILISYAMCQAVKDNLAIDEPAESKLEMSAHRRLPRDLTKLLNSVFLYNAIDLGDNYAKQRIKRDRIALFKLRQEYVRCKKEFSNGNDCMLAFARMYHIAQEITEKMEKMKAIFRDSAKLLENDPKSNSNESNESHELTAEPLTEMPSTPTIRSKDKQHTTSSPITSATSLTKEKKKMVKLHKIKPSKFTWIIDGHDDGNENFAPLEEKPTIQPSQFITEVDYDTMTTSTEINIDETIFKTKGPFVDIQFSLTTPASDVDSTVSVTTTQVSSDQTILTKMGHSTETQSSLSILPTAVDSTNWITTTEISSYDTSIFTTNDLLISTDVRTTGTTVHNAANADAIARINFGESDKDGFLTSKAKDIFTAKFKNSSGPINAAVKITNVMQSSDSRVWPSTKQPLTDEHQPTKNDWIIDGDNTSAIPTVVTLPSNDLETQQKKNLFESTIPNLSMESSVSLSSNFNATVPCNITLHTQNGISSFKCEVHRRTLNFEGDGQHFANEMHVLDNPSSTENLADSFEKEFGDMKHTKSAHKNETNKTLMLDHYNPKEWEKMFQKDTVFEKQLIESSADVDAKSMNQFAPKLNQVNINGFGISDSQFMTLCERIAKNGRNKGGNRGSPSMTQTQSETFTQTPHVEFTSRGPHGFPVTGESMKASAQFMFNPNLAMPTIPVCFYITPANLHMVNQAPIWSPSFFGMVGGYGGFNSALIGGGIGSPGGIYFVPQSFGGTGSFFGHSSGSGTGSQDNIPNIFTKNASPQKQQQLFCTYMKNQSNSQPNGGGTGGVGSGIGSSPDQAINGINFSNANFKMRASHASSTADIIYATYSGSSNQMERETNFKCELDGEVACYGGNQCIREDAWCNGSVECADGSDEAACTCRDRLLDDRICDGYPDCPLREDEIECFGCKDFMHSCRSSQEEFEHFNHSTISMCYSSIERCDGFMNCFNGRDELDCSVLVNDFTHHMSHSVSSSEGFLYHNYQGDWYPVCNNAEKWAKQACESEGSDFGSPIIAFRALSLPGPFIEPSLVGKANFPQSCQKRQDGGSLTDYVTHVTCPSMHCGLVHSAGEPMVSKLKSFVKRQMRKSQKIETKNKNERIVGGVYSKPMQWPFVVALYRNGMFHCGGTIYSDRWVISAAHCVINYQKYHYEVRAGVHRRTSYSVSTQIRSVSHIVLHQAYERRSMRNDLSMLRLAEVLFFNRWIKPICLPSLGRTTAGDDWIWGPDEKTLCTTVGWGAVMEKGPGSDQLREVVVPTLKRCKAKSDQESENICAGYAGGGSDACQGDSGGPLFCRSVSNSLEWYLAGVVSHGNGCARPGEFGVYTRVALFLDWIEMATRPELLPNVQPKQLCPGYVCIWGGKRCIPQRKRCDRIIDCLGGEDEAGCIYNSLTDVGAARNTSTTEADYFPQDGKSTQAILDDLQMSTKEHLLEMTTRTSGTISTEYDAILEKGAKALPINEMKEHMEQKSNTDQPPDIQISTLTPLYIHNLITTTANQRNTTLQWNTTTGPISASVTEKLPNKETTTLEVETTRKSAITLKTTVQNTSISVAPAKELETRSKHTIMFIITEATEASVDTSTTAVQRVYPKIRRRAKVVANATSPALAQKFVCSRIAQIIEFSLRCDRTADCEDGTDEDNCSCRDFMKHPLDVLICDGKVDCADSTDELDCGYCKSDEFMCPLSDICLPISKRCDSVIDCEFHEDEDKCLALTNGKQITFGAGKEVVLSNVGVITKNVGGIWRNVCFNDATIGRNGELTAARVCKKLGFRGYKFFSTTDTLASNPPIVPIEPAIVKTPRLKAHKALGIDNSEFLSEENTHPFDTRENSGALKERIAQTLDDCLAMYVECHAETAAIRPLKVLSAGTEMIPVPSKQPLRIQPELRINEKPNVFVASYVPTMLLERKGHDESDENVDLTIMVNNKLHEAVEELHWPWLVDIYANDSLRCAGVLLNYNWVMVHASCSNVLSLSEEYVVALFGGGITRHAADRNVEERIRRVDCRAMVPQSDVLLYHLEHPVQFTYHILPAFLPDFANYEESATTLRTECIALLHDNQFGHIRAMPMANCQHDALCRNSDMSCHRLIEKGTPTGDDSYSGTCDWTELKDGEYSVTQESHSHTFRCTEFGSQNANAETQLLIDQGIMMCRRKGKSWYPGAMFQYNNTNCRSFKQPFGMRTLEKVYKSLQKIIGQSQCSKTELAPTCSTFRCPLGTCLDRSQLCDGNNDCHDASDEDLSVCLEHNLVCKPSELKCRSTQKCIEKTKFCDHVPDCDDLTDEPTICSCLTYLQASEPEKICDGVRNCWDKSDESPAMCNCTENHFSCGTYSNECVPKDFVCDRQLDCPNGADEKYCLGIEYPMQQFENNNNSWKPNIKNPRPSRYGQVIEQTYGVWHTKCFPRISPPKATDVRKICKKLGYIPYRQPHYRLIEDATNEILESNEPPDQWGRHYSVNNSPSPGKYRDSSKAVVVSKFSPLHLNKVVTLLLRPSRPIAEISLWNTTDSIKCLRLEINCG